MAERPDLHILEQSDAALRTFGDTARGANWPNESDRRLRFDVMLDVMAGRGPGPVRLCDLGCGTGELLAHLRRRGMDDVEYVGVDRSHLALQHARAKFPDAQFLELDINADHADLGQLDCDFLVANGLFTVKWELSDAQMRAFIEGSLRRVWPHVRRGIAFNLISPVVDWERRDLYHASMDETARFLHGLAGRRVRLRADYGLYEYTACAWKTPVPEGAKDRGEDSGPLLPTPDPPAWLLQQARLNHVYPQQALKDLLKSALPRGEAFDAYRHAAALGDGARIERRLLVGMHEHLRDHARCYELQLPGGKAFTVMPPRTIGEGNQRPLQGHSRAAWIACVDHARVRSRSSVIEAAGRLLVDAEPGELDSIDDRMDLDPAVFDADASGAWVIEPDPALPVLEYAEAFSLIGPHSWAFGHWMWEFLPRYAAALRSARLPLLPVLVDQGMPVQHVQALRALLPPGAGIIELPSHAVARIGRLWCAPTPMYMPFFEHMNRRFRWDLLAAEPGYFAGLAREMRTRFLPGTARAAQRLIFLARRPERHRKLLNAGEIEAAALSRGFVQIYPEDMAFAEQVAAIDGAEHVVGPEGSAMFLALFARPGTRVTILNHPYTLGLPVLTGLLEALDMDVEVVVGPAETKNDELPHFLDYRVDVARFLAALDSKAVS